MPKNAFLNSYPRMSLIALPDRDQLTIPLSEGVDRTEVYYLSSFRLAIVRTVLASTSVPDALLKVFGYVMWPVLVLVLAAFQRNLAEVLLRPFRKKDSTRRIGFR